MAEQLAGRVAIVTGGGRGIGRAICVTLAEAGARVVIADLNPEEGRESERAIKDLGGDAAFVQADVTVPEQVSELVQKSLQLFKRIDVLVNNAGVHDQAPFCDEPPSLWDRMYRVNLLGTALMAQAAVRHMKAHGGGAIVNVASKAGVVGEPGHAAYSASKGAVIALTRSMAIELAPYRIRVNAVCPGPTDTDMLHAAVPTRKGLDDLVASIPLGRFGRPEDIAEAVLYLASPGSSWCTGQALSIDGGMSVLK